MATFEVVDLASMSSPTADVSVAGSVDLDALRDQLQQIRDSLSPLLDDQGQTAADETPIGLQELELALSISLEGKVWFIAKGSAEASITLTFGRAKAE